MSRPTIHSLYKVEIDDPQAQPLLLAVTQRIARRVWGSSTAYRLGLLSRLTGLDCPYPQDSHQGDLFERGREDAEVSAAITVKL